jgi:chemotaxis protein CheX
MNADQLKTFREIMLGFFSKMAPDEPPPALQEAYLRFGSAMLLDYTSVVFISGAYEGCLYVTAPQPFLEEILKLHHEPDISEKTRLDMCRELSNVLAGNASHAFGANWTISVPESLSSAQAQALTLPPSTFVMPFRWREIESFLVVGLTEKGKE